MKYEVLPAWNTEQFIREWKTCMITDESNKFNDRRPGNRTGNVRYQTMNGSQFIRDPDAPHKGNFVDALPYWSKATTVVCPPWNSSVTLYHGNNCVYMHHEGDGRYFTAILDDDFVYAPDQGVLDLIKGLATTKALAALRRADASIPMMLKERTETMSMLKSYAGRGLDLVKGRQLRDVGRWKKFLKTRPTSNQKKRFAQNIANEHLMFIFGMMPLIEEMEGLSKNLSRKEYKVITGRGREARDFEDTHVDRHTYGFTTVTKRRHKVSINVSLRCDIEIEFLARARKLGFNPLYTMYDFVPLSFVTGWFSNFGQYLQGLDPVVGLNYRHGSSSLRVKTRIDKECYGTESREGEPHHPGISTGHGTSFGESTMNVRDIIPEMPKGSLHFYNNLSLFSVLAATSLFVQRKVKIVHKGIKVKPFRYVSKKRPPLPPIKYVSTKQ